MKKIISLLICVMLLAAALPFSAFAADSADFKLSVVAQDDKSVTVEFSFVGGTGFSALDYEIKYNKVKLSLKEQDCKKGSGLTAFNEYASEKSGMSPIVSINAAKNPILGAFASIEPFKAINGDGSLAKIKFSKIPGTKLTESDITVTIENCQTYEFKDISVSVTTDLTGSVTNANASTEYAQNTSVDGKNDGKDSEIGESVQPSDGNSSGDSGSDASQNGGDGSGDSSSAEKSLKESSPLKKIIIIAAAVVCVAGIGTVVVLFVKNSKKNDGEF